MIVSLTARKSTPCFLPNLVGTAVLPDSDYKWLIYFSGSVLSTKNKEGLSHTSLRDALGWDWLCSCVGDSWIWICGQILYDLQPYSTERVGGAHWRGYFWRSLALPTLWRRAPVYYCPGWGPRLWSYKGHLGKDLQRAGGNSIIGAIDAETGDRRDRLGEGRKWPSPHRFVSFFRPRKNLECGSRDCWKERGSSVLRRKVSAICSTLFGIEMPVGLDHPIAMRCLSSSSLWVSAAWLETKLTT